MAGPVSFCACLLPVSRATGRGTVSGSLLFSDCVCLNEWNALQPAGTRQRCRLWDPSSCSSWRVSSSPASFYSSTPEGSSPHRSSASFYLSSKFTSQSPRPTSTRALSGSSLRPSTTTGLVRRVKQCLSLESRVTSAPFPSSRASSSASSHVSADRPTSSPLSLCVLPRSRTRPSSCVSRSSHRNPADACLPLEKRNCEDGPPSCSRPHSPTDSLSSSGLAYTWHSLPGIFLSAGLSLPSPPPGRRSCRHFFSVSSFSWVACASHPSFLSPLPFRALRASSFHSSSPLDSRNFFEDSGSSSGEEDASSSPPFAGFAPEAARNRRYEETLCRPSGSPRSAFDFKVGEGECYRSERTEAENRNRGRRSRALRDAAARRMLEKEDRALSVGWRRERGGSTDRKGDAEDGHVTPLISAFAAVRQARQKRGRERNDCVLSRCRDVSPSLSYGKTSLEALKKPPHLGSGVSAGHSQGLSSGLRGTTTSSFPGNGLLQEAEHAANSPHISPVSSVSCTPPVSAAGSPSLPASFGAPSLSACSSLESRFGVAVSPSVFEALNRDMQRLESLMMPGTEDQAGMRRFLSQLQDLLNSVLDACIVTPFGSAVNGLWTPQSDLDVCVQVRDASTRANQIKVLRQVAHALHPVHTHLVEPRFQARVPIIHWAPRFSHSTSGSVALSGRFLRDPVARALYERPGNERLRERGDNESARRTTAGRNLSEEGMEERNTQMVSCDISVNNLLAVVNSKLLGAYVGVDPRLRTLGYAVKFWAKGRNINDRSRGTVSSFSLVLMLIHFLQNHVQPRILPSLQDMAIHQRLPPVYIGGVDCRYTADPEAVQKELEFLRGGAPPNTESPGELLLQFFRYFGYEYRGGIIAIRDISHFCLSSGATSLDRRVGSVDCGGGFLFRDRRPKQGASRRGSPTQKLPAWGLNCDYSDDANHASSFASEFVGSDTREERAGDGEDDLLDSLSVSIREAELNSSGGDFLVVDNPFEVGKDVCNVLPCQYQRIRHEFKRAFRLLADGASFRQVASPDGKKVFW
ncbi:polynucleotide adenylyltransferase [Toxoplasma gondii RUB]|uniref:Polynucleotide adenylyltransferase n=1 Tax=Toxoplasma gondii RUB TaxID=935652 RepID=A0A086LL73_TOXGO|nr:polynucleotide adenylyltransferase [Toxoplasma gondii RUB]